MKRGILDRMLTDRAASPPAWPRATRGQARRRRACEVEHHSMILVREWTTSSGSGFRIIGVWLRLQ
jgi:hypothetical protein